MILQAVEIDPEDLTRSSLCPRIAWGPIISSIVTQISVCANCNRIYIGETGKGFSYRAGEHRTYINNATYRRLDVSHHIHKCAGHVPIPFRIAPFYNMPLNCSVIERRTKELFFSKNVSSFYSSRPSTRRRLIQVIP